MKELSDEQIEKIIELLKKGIYIPESYRLTLINHFEQIKEISPYQIARDLSLKRLN